MLSRSNPIVDPAATETVSEAWPGLALQRISREDTFSTGELLTGIRIAALVDPLP